MSGSDYNSLFYGKSFEDFQEFIRGRFPSWIVRKTDEGAIVIFPGLSVDENKELVSYGSGS